MLEFLDEKEKVEEEVVVEKPLTMFDYLTDITANKKGDIHIHKDPEMKQFNSFMILRYLSLDEGYLPLVNDINTFQDALSKEEMYKLLLFLIPRTRVFLRYPKQTKKDISEQDVDLITEFFKCSKSEAETFLSLKLLDSADVEKIRIKFGGKA